MIHLAPFEVTRKSIVQVEVYSYFKYSPSTLMNINISLCYPDHQHYYQQWICCLLFSKASFDLNEYPAESLCSPMKPL